MAQRTAQMNRSYYVKYREKVLQRQKRYRDNNKEVLNENRRKVRLQKKLERATTEEEKQELVRLSKISEKKIKSKNSPTSSITHKEKQKIKVSPEEQRVIQENRTQKKRKRDRLYYQRNKEKIRQKREKRKEIAKEDLIRYIQTWYKQPNGGVSILPYKTGAALLKQITELLNAPF